MAGEEVETCEESRTLEEGGGGGKGVLAGLVTLTAEEGGPFFLSRDALEDCKYLVDMEVSCYVKLDKNGNPEFPELLVRLGDSAYHLNSIGGPMIGPALQLVEVHACERKRGLSEKELAQVDREYLESLKLSPDDHNSLCLYLELLDHPACHIVHEMFMRRTDRPRLLTELSEEELDRICNPLDYDYPAPDPDIWQTI